MTTTTDALFAAIKEKDEKRVRELVTTNPGLYTVRSAQGLSPLMFAAYMRAPKIIGILREAGAEPSFHECAVLGDLERMKKLLARGPELLEAPGGDGFTALHLAAHFGQKPVLEWLLARGAKIDAPSSNYMAVVPLASAIAGGQAGVAKLLLAKGANGRATDSAGNTPLHSAAANGSFEMVKALLGAGVDVNARSRDGKTALTLAIEHEEDEIANALRTAGAKV